MNKEEIVILQFVNWFKMQYPQYINSLKVNYDNYKASIGVATKQKKLRTNVKGYPDITISVPKRAWHGLFIEAKADGVRIYQVKDRNKYSTPHLQEQGEYLNYLNGLGYYAVFGIGLDDLIEITNNYLKE